MLFVIGVDPGTTGAFCALAPHGHCAVFDLPTTSVSGAPTVSKRIDGRALRQAIVEAWRACLAAAPLEALTSPAGRDREPCEMHFACEAVHAREGDRNSMQSQGSLMRSLGAIEAAADILGAPPVLVQPQAWQAWYGLMGKGSEAQAKRAALKRGEIQRGELPEAVKLAARLFPRLADQLHLVKHHNRAEALLIGRFHLRSIRP